MIDRMHNFRGMTRVRTYIRHMFVLKALGGSTLQGISATHSGADVLTLYSRGVW